MDLSQRQIDEMKNELQICLEWIEADDVDRFKRGREIAEFIDSGMRQKSVAELMGLERSSISKEYTWFYDEFRDYLIFFLRLKGLIKDGFITFDEAVKTFEIQPEFLLERLRQRINMKRLKQKTI